MYFILGFSGKFLFQPIYVDYTNDAFLFLFKITFKSSAQKIELKWSIVGLLSKLWCKTPTFPLLSEMAGIIIGY